MARQSEMIKEQAATLLGYVEGKVDRVGQDRTPPVPPGKRKTPAMQTKKSPEAEAKRCTVCDYSQHTTGKCPAQKATCNKCHQKGHFVRVFKGRASVHEIISNNDVFFRAISSGYDGKLRAIMDIYGSPVTFKVDAGEDVIVIPHQMYEKISIICISRRPSSTAMSDLCSQ